LEHRTSPWIPDIVNDTVSRSAACQAHCGDNTSRGLRAGTIFVRARNCNW
jgi:hypothetical protein